MRSDYVKYGGEYVVGRQDECHSGARGDEVGETIGMPLKRKGGEQPPLRFPNFGSRVPVSVRIRSHVHLQTAVVHLTRLRWLESFGNIGAGGRGRRPRRATSLHVSVRSGAPTCSLQPYSQGNLDLLDRGSGHSGPSLKGYKGRSDFRGCYSAQHSLHPIHHLATLPYINEVKRKHHVVVIIKVKVKASMHFI